MTERARVGSLHVLAVVLVALAGAAGQGPYGHWRGWATLMLWASPPAPRVVLAMTTTLARERPKRRAAAADYQGAVDDTRRHGSVHRGRDATFVNETSVGCSRSRARARRRVGVGVHPRHAAGRNGRRPAGRRMVRGPAAGVSGLIRRSDGSCRWYRWTARLITTADGRSEFQAVGIDLTERRQAEEERAAIERKMQDAQRWRRWAVPAGGVAHDFNNLLAGVLGHAELAVPALADGHPAALPGDRHQRGRPGRRADAATARVLRQGPVPAPGDRPQRPHRPNHRAAPAHAAEEGAAHLNLAQGLPAVTGDDGQLRQVLMNLIINAGEAIGDRAGTVTVATVAHDCGWTR